MVSSCVGSAPSRERGRRLAGWITLRTLEIKSEGAACRCDSMGLGTILSGFVFSVIGLSLFVYGKRQQLFVPLLCGIALMALLVVVPDPIAMSIIGTIITVAGIALRFATE